LEQGKNLIKEKSFDQAISKFLAPVVRSIVTLDKIRKKNTILNLTVYRETCYQCAVCLKEFKEFSTANDYIMRAIATLSVSVIV